MFKKKKTYIILFLIIAIIGGIYYSKNKKPVVSYTTEKAEKGDLKRTVSVTGEVTAPAVADLSFKLSGQIEAMFVDIGDHVERGDKIATVDKGTLQSQLVQAEEAASVQRKTLADMKRKDETYSYYQKQAQEAVIKKAEEAVSEIRTQIGYATLYAPISGTVIKKNVEVGEITVANAVTTNTAVVTIAGDGELLTEVEVPESDIVDVAVGQKAEVVLDALPSSEILEATVTEIEPASTVIQDVVYYKVKLNFDKSDARLKVGMSTDVDIKTAEKKNVIMVPMRAIKNDGGADYVEILDAADNTTKKIEVKTGMSGDDGMVEVTSGLSGGEDVVVLTN